MTGKPKKRRLQLTHDQGLHRDFLIKRAAFLMRKAKRALSAYHAAKRTFAPTTPEEAEAQLATITDRASDYFKLNAETREAMAKIREHDEAVRDE